MEHQTLGRWVGRPSDPARQHIILKNDRFLVVFATNFHPFVFCHENKVLLFPRISLASARVSDTGNYTCRLGGVPTEIRHRSGFSGKCILSFPQINLSPEKLRQKKLGKFAKLPFLIYKLTKPPTLSFNNWKVLQNC